MHTLTNPWFIAITLLLLWKFRPVVQWWCVHSLRKVTVTFADNRTSEHVIHKWGLRNLIKAYVRLHHDPGVNPYNGCELQPIIQITAAQVCVDGPYWWATPNLGPNGDWLMSGGVPFIAFNHTHHDKKIVWQRPA